MRTERWKARCMVSALPKPQARAISARLCVVASSDRRAPSTRCASTYPAGVGPTSRRKARAKLRALMPALRERRDRQIGGEGVGEERLQVAKRPALRGPRGELAAEL